MRIVLNSHEYCIALWFCEIVNKTCVSNQIICLQTTYFLGKSDSDHKMLKGVRIPDTVGDVFLRRYAHAPNDYDPSDVSHVNLDLLTWNSVHNPHHSRIVPAAWSVAWT